MCIQTVSKKYPTPEKERNPINGKSAYAKWISKRRFEQISYNPGAEEVWIAGYTYAVSQQAQFKFHQPGSVVEYTVEQIAEIDKIIRNEKVKAEQRIADVIKELGELTNALENMEPERGSENWCAMQAYKRCIALLREKEE